MIMTQRRVQSDSEIKKMKEKEKRKMKIQKRKENTHWNVMYNVKFNRNVMHTDLLLINEINFIRFKSETGI